MSVQPFIKETSLAELGGWGRKTVQSFNKYLIAYQTVPLYKKLLGSLIKFGEMYPLLRRYGKTIEQPEYLGGENEYRRLQRARIQLTQKDLVSVLDPGSGRKIIVTSKGHKIFFSEFPLSVLRKQKWDGWWLIVMYDFPEKLKMERDRLREKLTNLGFGHPQISLLVSPLPLSSQIQQLVEDEEMKSFVWVLRAKRVLGLENKEVALRAWPIEEINLLYKSLVNILPEVKKRGDKNLLIEWQTYFLALNCSDPYLPEELLPSDWMGNVCEKEATKLKYPTFIQALLK